MLCKTTSGVGLELSAGAHALYVGAKKVHSRRNNGLLEGNMRAYKLEHPFCVAAFETHSVAQTLSGDVCALTAMTVTATTTSNLENMEDFIKDKYLVVKA